ncbi:MAG: hypothetical protein AAFW47_05075, partial [Pseudomonadota bacterium]
MREPKALKHDHFEPRTRSRAKAIARDASDLKTRMGLVLLAALLVISALLFTMTGANAQESGSTSAQSSVDSGPVEGTVPGGSSGTTSDSDLWRALKGGENATTSIRSAGEGVAIQAVGQSWREFRNEGYFTYSAWGMLGTIGLLAVFFALRGRIRIGHGGPAGETISRFTLIERAGHWLLASSFIILALTGLNLVYGRDLLIPLLGKEAFATISIYGKIAHNYVAFAFMVALVWVALT